MSDYILRATAGNGAIRGFFATTVDTVSKATKLHHTSPTASAALGRVLTAAAIMGTDMKNDTDLITLQVKGDGPLRGVLASADHCGNVRGYVDIPQAETPLKYPGKLDVGAAIGKGTLRVMKDIGLKEPYCGEIELVSGEIAEDLTYYFAKSEQTPSAVGLGVLVDVDYSICQAGGFFVQLMPFAEEEVIKKLEENLAKLPPVTELLEREKTPERMMELIFQSMEYQITEKTPVSFQCSCSRKKVEETLLSLGQKELEDIVKEDEKAEIHCHFCNKKYYFTKEDLIGLIQSIDKKVESKEG
ncbi:MAG: Hsp33 family molecular chaperone HslO [Clostridiales bacterium]|nr:Hsp33 family molecular chaperone HslO [Clostridiales bacterium]